MSDPLVAMVQRPVQRITLFKFAFAILLCGVATLQIAALVRSHAASSKFIDKMEDQCREIMKHRAEPQADPEWSLAFCSDDSAASIIGIVIGASSSVVRGTVTDVTPVPISFESLVLDLCGSYEIWIDYREIAADNACRRHDAVLRCGDISVSTSDEPCRADDRLTADEYRLEVLASLKRVFTYTPLRSHGHV